MNMDTEEENESKEFPDDYHHRDSAMDIIAIQFGFLSPERILKESVCEVTDPSLYNKQLPRTGGLNDLRMGTSDWLMNCSTCKNGIMNCVGHPGHIKLASPVFHAGVMDTIIKVLRCVCFFCSEFLIENDHTKFETSRVQQAIDKGRLRKVSEIAKTRHFCPHCEGPQPNYSRQKNAKQRYGVKHEFEARIMDKFESDEEKEWALQTLDPPRVFSILKHINDEACMKMGLNPSQSRPEWMILSVLVVPPPIIRPSIKHSDDSRMRGQDDITIHLQDILKTNIKLKAAMEEDPQSTTTQTLKDELQFLIGIYVHHDTAPGVVGGAANSGSGPPHSNREKRLFHKRFKGKKGRIRGTLSGKRVNFCSRSVISPDPVGDIDQVGVPRPVACKLTLPIKVTHFNLEDLQQRVLRGPGVLHGAANVIEPDGTVRNLALLEDRSIIQLEPGWTVERHLQNDDMVLFNRQPSLHKMSIMAHRVKVVDGESFRLPLCDTTAYNADYDGDEMNAHAVQTVTAQAELSELISTKKQIISAQANKPIISLVQDSLIAAYLLTLQDTFIDRGTFMQLTMNIKHPVFEKLPPPAIWKPKKLWTGKQLFSLLLPDIHLEKTVRNGGAAGVDKTSEGYLDVEERRVLIVEGSLLTGTMCKKTLGNAAGGVVHILVNDMGHDVAAHFIGDAQRMLVDYMERRGFSVGIQDCVTDKNVDTDVRETIDRCFKTSKNIQDQAVNAPKRVTEGIVQNMMQSMIAKCSSIVQKHMDWKNNINLLVTSGAKGSPVNISQIMASVGQQTVGGQRLLLDKNGRSLGCYKPFESHPESRGFVRNSYQTGLTAREYFDHARGGREGLVDTAVKTAVTGYIQRRLVKAQEGVMVQYDGSVRTPQGRLFQRYYGCDGIDAVYIEKQTVPTYSMDDAVLYNKYMVSHEEAQTICEHEFQQLRQDRDLFRHLKSKFDVYDGTVFVPINVKRLLKYAKYRFKDAGQLASLDYVVHQRQQLFNTIYNAQHPDSTVFLLIYLRATLALKPLLDATELKKDAIDWLFQRVEYLFMRSRVEPGEMVGTLGACCIGEPCTQMTLNTFHTAGVENKNMTLGVPRLKEIIDSSKVPKTPCMSVYLAAPYCHNEKMARSIAAGLTDIKLHAVVESSEIVLDPDWGATKIADDNQIVALHTALYPIPPSTTSQWVIRLLLKRETLIHHELDISHVRSAIRSFLSPDDAEIISSEVNMVHWCVRIRLNNMDKLIAAKDLAEPKLEETACKTVHDFLLDNISIHGVSGIMRTIPHTEEHVQFDKDTGAVRKTPEWTVDAEGTNLKDMLIQDGIDKTRTICNNIHEVAKVLGIEAAWNVMLDELRAVLSFDGGYVDDHHMQLLADLMTQNGTPVAVTRHGLKDLGGSIYQRASYEEPMEVMFDAGAFGMHDKLTGITGTIMLGQRMSAGTGLCKVLTRKDAMPVPVQPSIVVPMEDEEDTADMLVKPLDLSEEDGPHPKTSRKFDFGQGRGGGPMLVRPLQLDLTIKPKRYCPVSPELKPAKKRIFRPASPDDNQ